MRFCHPEVNDVMQNGLADKVYSGKFSLVQIFAEKRPDSPEKIFAVFIFADVGRSGHTLPVDGHAPYAKPH